MAPPTKIRSFSMQNFWKLLSVIAVSFVVTACGGSGGGGSSPSYPTTSISGTTLPGTTITSELIINGSVQATTSIVTDVNGNYSYSGLVNGRYAITPSLTGYGFYAPSAVTVDGTTGGTFTGIDFSAIPRGVPINNTGTIRGTGSGTGVVFSKAVGGGFNSITDISYSNSAYAGGGLTIAAGSEYYWQNSNGSTAKLIYDSMHNILYVTFGSGYGGSYWPASTGCGVVSKVTAMYPLCSSVGITLDRAAGMITFASTPLQDGSSPSLVGITATGSLSFFPF